MDRDLAEKTLLTVYQSNFILDSYLSTLKDQLEPEEFTKYCKKFGAIMGETLFEVMNPLYEEHPDLKPEQMGGEYKTNDSHYKKIYDLVIEQASEKNS